MILFVVACTRAPELVGIDNPDIPASTVVDATKHTVFIATTREDTEVVGALFSELRSDELGLASVEVSVPPTHVVGALERPQTLPPDMTVKLRAGPFAGRGQKVQKITRDKALRLVRPAA